MVNHVGYNNYMSGQRKITPPDDLEVFDRRKPAPTEKTWVTRTKAGYFIINRASHAALGKPEAIEYVYSPKARILGFRGADPEAENSYPLYSQGHSKNYQCAGQALHTFYGIPMDQTIRYPSELIGDTLYIDLNDKAAIPVGRQKAKG